MIFFLMFLNKGFDAIFVYAPLGIFISIYILFIPFALQVGFQRMKFVKVAERAFSALGWKDVENIDLPKSSKPRQPDDPGEFGTFYFRY